MRLALPFLLLALVVPASAAAQDGDPPDHEPTPTETGTDSGAPTGLAELDYAGPAARISRGRPLIFAVRTDAPAGSVIVRVSTSEETDENGLLSGDDGTWADETASPAGEGVQAWSAPASLGGISIAPSACGSAG